MFRIRTYFSFIIIFFLLFSSVLRAQLSGNYSVPGSFSTVAAAIYSLNMAGINGPVTIDVSAGHTEVAPVGGYSLYALAGASSTSGVTFQKQGIGANPLLLAQQGLYVWGNFIQDGIFRFIGADYITIDGIDLLDTNSFTPNTMEFGYGFFKQNSTNGSLFNTIRNCTVTLNRNNFGIPNNTQSTSGSRGIEVSMTTPANHMLNVVATSTAGANSYNRFYSNMIQNCYIPFSLVGMNTFSHSPMMDFRNDIGGLMTVTGNTLQNFTGVAVKTWGQDSLNVSHNYIDNAAVGGTVNVGVRGFYFGDASGADIICVQNTLTIVSMVSSSSFPLVHSEVGGGVNSLASVRFDRNLFLNCVSRGLYDAKGITQLAYVQNISITGNKFINFTTDCNDGDVQMIYSYGTASGLVRVDSNEIHLIMTHTGTLTTDFAMIEQGGGFATSTISISDNIFTNFSQAASQISGDMQYISANSAGIIEVSRNSWVNITQRNRESYFIKAMNCTKTLSIAHNSIIGTYDNPGIGGSLDLIRGTASGSTALVSIHHNNFSSLTSTVGGYGGRSGIYVSTTLKPQVLIHDNVISNVDWRSANNGGEILYFNHAGTGSGALPSSIYNNTFSNVVFGGAVIGMMIYGGGTVAIDVHHNQIVDISSSHGTYSVCGLYAWANPLNFHHNKIAGVVSTGSLSKSYGIYLDMANNMNLYNNVIGGVATPSTNGSNMSTGLYCDDGTSIKLYNNTFFMSGTSSGTLHSTNVILTSTVVGLDMRNNILVNTSVPKGTGKTAVLRGLQLGTAQYSATSNNNLVYAGVPASSLLLLTDGTNNDQSLAQYKTRMGLREFLTVTELPPFASTITSSPNYLSLSTTATTQVEGGAQPIGIINDDYVGTIRHVTKPDIGAWEDNYNGVDLTAPYLVAAGFISPVCNLSGRTYSAQLMDVAGIATGSLAPRVYYKVNSGLYSSAQGTLVSGSVHNGVWNFFLGYSVNSNDVISYYLTAQDAASPINLMASPSTGFVASNVNNVTTHPTTPSNYVIGLILNGTYTVGAGGTWTTLTAAANAYNQSCLAGPVTYVLNNATYSVGETFPITFSNHINASSTNSLLIIPSTNNNVSIYGSSIASAVIKFHNARYITLDGSQSNGSITVTNGSANTSAAFWLASSSGTGPGCRHVTIKNSTIVGGSTTFTNNFGVYIGMDAGSPQRNGGYNNDSISILSNTVLVANTGIYASGTSTITAGAMDNLKILDNVIGPPPLTSTTSMPAGSGIVINNANGAQIKNNFVRNIFTTGLYIRGIDLMNMSLSVIGQNTVNGLFANSSTSGSGDYICGILVGDEVITSTITANTVKSIYNTNSYGYSLRGIMINTGNPRSHDKVYNNMVSDIVGTSNYWPLDWPAGIGIEGNTDTVDIAFNSVAMTGTFNTFGLGGASAAFFNESSGNKTIRNNIFYNTQHDPLNSFDACYATYFYSSSPGVATDYNLYYAASAAATVGLVNNAPNMTAVLGSFSGNLNSVSMQPFFISSANDLHIAIATSNIGLDNLGSPPPTVSVDIDSQSRHLTTPDIGADEYTIPVCYTANAGTIANAFVNLCNGQSVVLNSDSASKGVNALYQWQVSNSSVGTFTNVSQGVGGTTSTYSPGVLPQGQYFYKFNLSCGGGTVTANVATVTVYPNLTLTLPANSASICSGKNMTLALNTSTVATFLWSGPLGYTSAIQSPVFNNISLSSSGVYTVTAAANGCSATPLTFSLNVVEIPAPLSVNISSVTICSTANATLTVSGGSLSTITGTNYLWTPSTGLSSTNTSTVIASPPQSMVYTVAVNNAGCSVTSTVFVNVVQMPTLSINSNAPGVCSGQSLTLTATGGNNYTWFNASTTNSIVVTPVANTSYSVTSTLSPCATASVVLFVSWYPLPTVNIVPSSSLICSGEVYTLSANGANSYLWSDNSITSSIQFTATIPTTYQVVGTSTAGCKATTSTVINALPVPTVIINSSATAVCPGKSVTLTATGATAYQWTGGPATSQYSFVPTVTTNYTVVGTHTNGCTDSKNILINVFTPGTLSLSTGNQTHICLGEELHVDASGALSYSWLPFGGAGSSATLLPLVPLNFTITGVDQNGCDITANLQVDVQACASLTELDNAELILVYPNPAQSFVRVSSFGLEISRCVVLDYLSREVCLFSVPGKELALDLSPLSRGSYILKIETDKGFFYKRLVLN